jgi:hypothetical protein
MITTGSLLLPFEARGREKRVSHREQDQAAVALRKQGAKEAHLLLCIAFVRGGRSNKRAVRWFAPPRPAPYAPALKVGFRLSLG